MVKVSATMDQYSNSQKWILFILRQVIGWHFLFEGISKLFTPNWSAESYLSMSGWIFSGFFRWIASSPSTLAFVDFLNIWGLILIGLALMLGVRVRIASILGMALLGFYYLAHPPFIGLDFGISTEGNYLVVNKNLVELFALGILVFFPASSVWGVEHFIQLIKLRKQNHTASKSNKNDATDIEPEELPDLTRREMIKSFATVPFLGAFGISLFQKKRWESWEEKNLVDAVTSASAKTFDFTSMKDLKDEMPKIDVNGTPFSRLIMGGNLLSGWAHSRDLIYVSHLVKAYHHKDKIFATLLMAERCGVNTLLTNPIMCTMIDEYWKRGIGNIQFISDCVALGYNEHGAYDMGFEEGLMKNIKKAINYGACACYIQGETTDWYREHNKLEQIGNALEYIRSQGVLAGLGHTGLNLLKPVLTMVSNQTFG